MNQPAPTGTALLKVDEAAAELRVSRATVYRLINRGHIHVLYIGAGRGHGNGRSIRISRDALNAYLDACAPSPSSVFAIPDVESA